MRDSRGGRTESVLARVAPPTGSPDSAVIPVAAALRPTAGDAVAVLVLRCIRTISWVLVALGVAVAIRTGSEVDPEDFTTARGLLQSILSPLAVLASGVLVRVLLTPLAWLSALVVALRSPPRIEPPPGRLPSVGVRWLDVSRLTGGLRALRWTTAVRDACVARLGGAGRALLYVDYALKGLVGLGWTAAVVVAVT